MPLDCFCPWPCLWQHPHVAGDGLGAPGGCGPRRATFQTFSAWSASARRFINTLGYHSGQGLEAGFAPASTLTPSGVWPHGQSYAKRVIAGPLPAACAARVMPYRTGWGWQGARPQWGSGSGCAYRPVHRPLRAAVQLRTADPLYPCLALMQVFCPECPPRSQHGSREPPPQGQPDRTPLHLPHLRRRMQRPSPRATAALPSPCRG